MQAFHHYYQHHLNFKKLFHSEFWLFEFSIWLHVFAKSLIAIFVPILLLKNGYAVSEVMLFYLLMAVFVLPLNFYSRWLIRLIGARYVMILSNLAIIGFFITFFNFVENSIFFLIALAILAALYDTFYWIAHLYLFMKLERKVKESRQETSILWIVKRFAGILGPVLGALILIIANQQILIIISIIIFALSLIPLFKVKHISDKPEEKQLSFSEFFKNKREKKNYLSMSLWGLHGSAENSLLPIFIFLLFNSIESVAIISVIVSVVTIIFTYFTGKMHKRSSGLIALGAFLITLVWIARLFFDNGIFYLVTVGFIGIFSILVSIPLDGDIFRRGNQLDPLSASMYRNTFSMISRIPLYFFLVILINIFEISFIVAASAAFIIMAINYIFLKNTSTKIETGQQIVVTK